MNEGKGQPPLERICARSPARSSKRGPGDYAMKARTEAR
jgi:hypothetical protein